MRFKLTTFLSIIFFILRSYCYASNSSFAFLSGVILDIKSNEVVSSAQVELSKENFDFELKTMSDIRGEFEFYNLSPGEYIIKITRLGYQPYIQKILLETEEKKRLTIYLEPAQIETEKINVTASRTEVTLQKTPSSIVIVSQDEIKLNNVLTFDKIMENVQGVSINRTSGINVSSLSIRGSSDVAGGGIGNRVLLLIDGRPSLTGDSKGALWSLVPISIIERTEIVKGAFSSLYGSSAIGGVVNIITRKPTYGPMTMLKLDFGFYEKLSDSLRFTNSLLVNRGVSLINSNTLGKLAYLFNGEYKKSDGYAMQTNYEFLSLYGKVMYDLFSNRDLEVTAQYTTSESGYPHYWKKDPGKLAEPYKVSDIYIGDRINKESQSIDFFYRAIPNSKSRYTSRFYLYRLNSTSSYNPQNPVSIQYGTPGSEFQTFITSYNFGNLSQVDFDLSERHYLIGGIDLQWNVVKSSPESILYGNQQQNNLGIYAQEQWNLIYNERTHNSILSSTLGLRYDFNQFVGGSGVSELSPKFSLLYSPESKSKLFENTSYRFLIGRAFRSPSIAELYFKKELFGGFEFVYNPNLEPEEMVSIELGLRKQYTNRFTLDFALFYNFYNNLIQYVNIGPTPLGPFQVQNIARAQIKGFEILFNYQSNLNILSKPFSYKYEVSYSYIDARDLSEKRDNDYLPYKPKHLLNFNVGLNYLGFDLFVYGKYVGKVDEVLFFKYEEPDAYFLLNATLGKEVTERIKLMFSVNNLFNKFYQELERIPAPNRNYSMSITIHF
ncbi:MAG: TonB-dependent receptor [Ignavibacteria bacterium]